MSELNSLLPKTKVDLLRRTLNRDATISALATESGMHVSVVRRHMEQLVAAGLVEQRTERSGRGRPHAIYNPTTEGREVLCARYDLVLETITRVLSDPAKVEIGRKAFAEAARVLAADIGAPRTLDTTLPYLKDVGFQPEIRKENGNQLLTSHNCPVLKIAEKYPGLVCDTFHTTLVGALLGTHDVRMGPTISRGAPECIHFLGKGRSRLPRSGVGRSD